MARHGSRRSSHTCLSEPNAEMIITFTGRRLPRSIGLPAQALEKLTATSSAATRAPRIKAGTLAIRNLPDWYGTRAGRGRTTTSSPPWVAQATGVLTRRIIASARVASGPRARGIGFLNDLFYGRSYSAGPAELSIPVLLDEKSTVVPVRLAGEQSGGKRKVSYGDARSNSERAAPSAWVGKRLSAPQIV